jgi:hypothetical protein
VWVSRLRQFLDQAVGVIDRPQSLEDAARVYRHGTRDLIIITEIEDKRLDVAVEDQADDLVVAVDYRAARIVRPARATR